MAKKLIRYYLHGDEKEGVAGQYYCRSCDLFQDEQHFHSAHPNQNDFEVFSLSYRRFKKKCKEDPKALHRPAKVSNLFE